MESGRWSRSAGAACESSRTRANGWCSRELRLCSGRSSTAAWGSWSSAQLLIISVLLGRSRGSSLPGDGSSASVTGLGVFLATFGFFVALVPLAGRFPYHREIVVNRAAGRFVRRDRTLVRLRQETFPLEAVRTVNVEEARHVDGDPYFTLVLRLESGDSVTLDRFTDRPAADRAAQLIRDGLSPVNGRRPSRHRPLNPFRTDLRR